DVALGYEATGGYELFRPEDAGQYRQCLDRREDINRILKEMTGLAETFVEADADLPGLGFGGMAHRLHNQAEGVLDTGRLMRSLLDKAQEVGVRWLGGIAVEGWQEDAAGVEVTTDQGWTVKTRRALIATNGLAHHLLPDWPVKPARNQVLITHPIAGGVSWQGGYHYQEGYLYFRPVGDRILLGGGRHWDFAGETTADLGAHEAIRAQLARLLHEVIAPGRSLSIDRWWSGIMGVGDRKAPLIQALGQHTVAAVRLGGMGVAIGTWVGEEGARLLLGQST
ncbi:MAG: FAD-binding oxidoreductase, partial [Lewinella sp.]|nr:FAD-binding oxidoreductase [Lewinella sp.]